MNSCGVCGREMKPLFSSYFCPNDCDKSDGIPAHKEDETTQPHAKAQCPKCGSHDVKPFAYFYARAMHCIDCGAVW